MTSLHSIATAFREGGWGMILILLILVASVVIIVDRALVLLRGKDAGPLMARLARLLRDRDVAGAASLCEQTDTPLSRIVGAGLSQSPAGEQRVLACMEEAARRELPRLEKRTGYLALLGNIATLAGLLGTIVGLIQAFTAVANANPAEKADLLSASISVAMNTTAFGLIVAIPLLITHSVLTAKTGEIVDSLEMASVKALNVITSMAKRQSTV